MQVPLACDLGQVLPQLAYLRSFEGVVDLALKKATALDPEELASRPDGDSAREVCTPQTCTCLHHGCTHGSPLLVSALSKRGTTFGRGLTCWTGHMSGLVCSF